MTALRTMSGEDAQCCARSAGLRRRRGAAPHVSMANGAGAVGKCAGAHRGREIAYQRPYDAGYRHVKGVFVATLRTAGHAGGSGRRCVRLAGVHAGTVARRPCGQRCRHVPGRCRGGAGSWVRATLVDSCQCRKFSLISRRHTETLTLPASLAATVPTRIEGMRA